MEESENHPSKNRMVVWIPLIMAIIAAIGLLYNWHISSLRNEVNAITSSKDRDISQISSQHMKEMEALKEEKINETIDKKAAQYALEYIQKDVSRMSDENLELLKRNSTISDSLVGLQFKMNRYESRIQEAGAYECREIFDNQFIIAFYGIYEDSTPPEFYLSTYVEADMEYIGNDRDFYFLGPEDSTLNYDTCIPCFTGAALAIKYKDTWYGVRISWGLIRRNRRLNSPPTLPILNPLDMGYYTGRFTWNKSNCRVQLSVGQ